MRQRRIIMKKIVLTALGVVATAALSATLAVPAQANGRPAHQQVEMPASGTCADVSAPASLNWSGVGSGGWTRQWGGWANANKGGFVCGRTLVLNSSTRKYQVQ
jgi:hypothetical protein